MAKSGFQIAMNTKTVDEFKKYLRRVKRSQNPILSKAGAFIRTAARSSIKQAGKRATANKSKFAKDIGRGSMMDPTVSRPGSPPKGHGAGLLRKLIMFQVDKRRQNVIIGPLKLNKKIKGIPSALEFGGRSKVSVFAPRSRTGKVRKKTKTITVRARPYMGPALKQERPKFIRLYRDSIK